MQVTDDLGRVVSISKPPQRIISLVPNLTEILYALGLGERVVAVCEYSDFPPAAAKKPLVGRHDRPSIEKVASFHPDLVLLGFGNPKELAPALERTGITAFALNPKNLEEVIRTIERVGEICGVSEKAKKVAADLRTRLAKVRKQTAQPHLKRPRVFIMIDEEPIWTAGADTLQDEILRLAGGVNVVAKRASYFAYSKESLFADQPDAILIGVTSAQAEATVARLRARKDLQTLSAVRSGHILTIDADTFSRPGPRAVDAVERLSELLANLPNPAGESSK